MKQETARKLLNRLNRQLNETSEVLAMLDQVIHNVDNERDYNIALNEFNCFKNKKQDLTIEIGKLEKSL